MNRCPAPPDLERGFFEGDAAIEQHATSCSVCRTTWREIASLTELASTAGNKPDAARRERMRTIVTSGVAPVHRRSRWPLVAAAVAAAVMFAALLVSDPWPTRPRGQVAAFADARFESVGEPGDEIVVLRDGRIHVEVDDLAPDERFRVRTDDAVVEVRGTSFDVVARDGALIEVTVAEGRVEVRHRDAPAAVLRRDDRWIPPEPKAAPKTPEPVEVETQRAPEPEPVRESERVRSKARPRPALPSAPPIPETVDHYQTGWSHLREENFTAAAESFRAAIQARQSMEDARYFLAVALGRDDRATATIGALEDFLAYHPGSPRAGDAAAMLGWLHYERGARAPARRAFERALESPSPRARKSAADGIQALDEGR